jgi:5-methylcytosine-specific restriction endonuclease McrA
MRARSAAWKKANPDQANTQNRNRRALRAAAKGTHDESDIQALFKLQNGRCAYCGKRIKTYHVDHILPLSKGGTNEPRNLQLTCGKCNLTKGARHPLDHARLIGRLL